VSLKTQETSETRATQGFQARKTGAITTPFFSRSNFLQIFFILKPASDKAFRKNLLKIEKIILKILDMNEN